MKLYLIVEGHGEVAAAPVLLRRLLVEAQCHDLQISSPIKRTHAQFRNKEGIQKAVKLAQLNKDCAAVLVLFDGEDDCPKEQGEQVRGWVREVTGGRMPADVVIAYREYETWFLASISSLRGRYGIAANATEPVNPESKRDAKGALEAFMPVERVYSETGDQPGMSAVFDMALAHRNNRSFRKLVKAVGEVLGQLNHPLPQWPPAGWVAS